MKWKNRWLVRVVVVCASVGSVWDLLGHRRSPGRTLHRRFAVFCSCRVARSCLVQSPLHLVCLGRHKPATPSAPAAPAAGERNSAPPPRHAWRAAPPRHHGHGHRRTFVRRQRSSSRKDALPAAAPTSWLRCTPVVLLGVQVATARLHDGAAEGLLSVHYPDNGVSSQQQQRSHERSQAGALVLARTHPHTMAQHQHSTMAK
eukprot:COSAG04_NODE_2736_length_3656_cov_2.037672_2_plen_202_part_00